MVIKNKVCLAGIFILPLALIAYFISQVRHLDGTLIPLQGTIYTFESRGSHSNYRKIVKLEEYPANFVRYYEGANMLFVKNFRDVIYEPPPASAITDIYYLHPTLRSKTERQVTLCIIKTDKPKLKQSGLEVPYFYLQSRDTARSTAAYNLNLYLYVYRYHNGTVILFLSLMMFLGCCIGASCWMEQYKGLLIYAITVIVICVLMFIF